MTAKAKISLLMCALLLFVLLYVLGNFLLGLWLSVDATPSGFVRFDRALADVGAYCRAQSWGGRLKPPGFSRFYQGIAQKQGKELRAYLEQVSRGMVLECRVRRWFVRHAAPLLTVPDLVAFLQQWLRRVQAARVFAVACREHVLARGALSREDCAAWWNGFYRELAVNLQQGRETADQALAAFRAYGGVQRRIHQWLCRIRQRNLYLAWYPAYESLSGACCVWQDIIGQAEGAQTALKNTYQGKPVHWLCLRPLTRKLAEFRQYLAGLKAKTATRLAHYRGANLLNVNPRYSPNSQLLYRSLHHLGAADETLIIGAVVNCAPWYRAFGIHVAKDTHAVTFTTPDMGVLSAIAATFRHLQPQLAGSGHLPEKGVAEGRKGSREDNLEPSSAGDAAVLPILYCRHNRRDKAYSLCLCDAKGKQHSDIFQQDAAICHPKWYNWRSIVYDSRASSSGIGEIFIVAADGAKTRQLTVTDGHDVGCSHPVPLPGRREVHFVCDFALGQADAMALQLDSGRVRRLSDFSKQFLQFAEVAYSGNGAIAYILHDPFWAPTREIFIGPLTGTAREVTDNDNCEQDIVLSTDGRYLAFAREMAFAAQDRRFDVWLLDTATGKEWQVSHSKPGQECQQPCFSPCGRYLLVSWFDGRQWDIIRTDKQGDTWHNITRTKGADERWPDWLCPAKCAAY